jgi:hypothetical protein
VVVVVEHQFLLLHILVPLEIFLLFQQLHQRVVGLVLIKQPVLVDLVVVVEEEVREQEQQEMILHRLPHKVMLVVLEILMVVVVVAEVLQPLEHLELVLVLEKVVDLVELEEQQKF